MLKPVFGLILSLLATASIAAADASCEAYDKLRAQRDSALQKKDFKQYCNALSGLIRLMPEKPPAPAQLQCEAKATNMKPDTWLGVRPTVVSSMQTTFDQNCR